jgi:EAL domain-containing protein (putative c-di-GMP-specific phosphodiesterase class I)
MLRSLSHCEGSVKHLLVKVIAAMTDSEFPIVIEDIEESREVESIDISRAYLQGFLFGRPVPWWEIVPSEGEEAVIAYPFELDRSIMRWRA